MIRMRCIIFVAFAGFSMIMPAFAGETGAAFLKMDVGARSAGMGSAFTAVADDASAIYWNPAGTSGIRKPQVFLMHSERFSGMNHEVASYIHPTRRGAVGAGISYLSQGTFEGRSEDRKPTGDFSASDIAGFFTFSRAIRGAGLGMNLKIIQQSIESEQARGFAFDIGGRYSQAGSPFFFGAAIQNIGPQMKFLDQRYNLPLTLAGGAGYRAWDKLTLAVDLKQGVYGGSTSVSFGAEFWALGSLALRTGYFSPIGSRSTGGSSSGGSTDFQNSNVTRLGAGIGLKLFGYQIDYALVPFGELGNVHQVSLIAGF